LETNYPHFIETEVTLLLSEPPGIWLFPEPKLEKAESFLKVQKEENKN
jgi:hypothetical protein